MKTKMNRTYTEILAFLCGVYENPDNRLDHLNKDFQRVEHKEYNLLFEGAQNYIYAIQKRNEAKLLGIIPQKNSKILLKQKILQEKQSKEEEKIGNKEKKEEKKQETEKKSKGEKKSNLKFHLSNI